MKRIAALCLASCISASSSAQTPDCSPSPDVISQSCPDQGAAYAAAWAAATEQASRSNNTPGIEWKPYVDPDGASSYMGYIRRTDVATGAYAAIWRSFKTKCSARPEEFGWAGGETSASVNVCERGCMYTSSLDPQGAAGYSYSPTGGTCTTSDAPEPTPAGDGTDPGGGGGETGGGDGGGTNPGGGDGDGGGGTNPGGGDGGGGGGTGPSDGDGDDGGGDGGGTGPGPGPGEGDGDGDGPGTPGEDGGPLYEHDKDLTIPKVYAEFEQRVKKAPIIDATKRFFTVSVGGSCPVFTVPASAYWEAMTFDLHCSGAIFALLQLIGWVLLAMAAYKAGEIALT